MRKILALGIVVLLVIVGWTAGWFWASGQIRDQVQALAANDGDTAPQLTCGALGVGGFPFRFDVSCEPATLVDADETLTLAGLRASVLVYNPTHLIFSAKSPYAMQNAFTGSASRVDFTALDGSAHVTTDDLFKGFSGEGWRIGRISVIADGVVWNDTVMSDVLQARADHIEAHLLDIPEQHDKTKGVAALAAYAEVKNLDAPAFQIAGGNGTFEANISGLPDDLMVLANDPEPLRNWQRRGGVFDLVRFEGTQPQPDENFTISGKASLTDTGLVNAQLAYSGKNVLDRFSKLVPPVQMALIKGKQDGAGGFANSMTMVDGKLRLLTLTLAELPPVF